MSFFKRIFGKSGGDDAPQGPPLVVPGDSVDGIRFGVGREAIIARYGHPEEEKVFEPDPEYDEPEEKRYLIYLSKGITALLMDGRLTSFFLYSGIPAGYEKGDKSKFECRLENGLTIDSDYAEVERVMGKPSRVSVNEYAPIPSYDTSYPGISFSFVHATGQLSYMCVTAPDA